MFLLFLFCFLYISWSILVQPGESSVSPAQQIIIQLFGSTQFVCFLAHTKIWGLKLWLIRISNSGSLLVTHWWSYHLREECKQTSLPPQPDLLRRVHFINSVFTLTSFFFNISSSKTCSWSFRVSRERLEHPSQFFGKRRPCGACDQPCQEQWYVVPHRWLCAWCYGPHSYGFHCAVFVEESPAECHTEWVISISLCFSKDG